MKYDFFFCYKKFFVFSQKVVFLVNVIKLKLKPSPSPNPTANMSQWAKCLNNLPYARIVIRSLFVHGKNRNV